MLLLNGHTDDTFISDASYFIALMCALCLGFGASVQRETNTEVPVTPESSYTVQLCTHMTCECVLCVYIAERNVFMA